MSSSSPYSHGVHPFQRLRRLLKAESSDVWIAVIYSIAIGLVSLVLPVAIQALVNTVAFGVLLQPLVILSLLVLVALLFAAALNGLRTYVVEVIQRRIFVRTAGDVSARLVRVQPSAFDRYHGPELVNRFLEVVTVQKSGASLLVDGLSVVFQTTIGMVLLAVYHPWLLAFDVLLLLAILVVVFPMGIGAIPAAVKESKAKYNVLAWMQEIARHQISFKTHQGERVALERMNGLVTEYLDYRQKGFGIWIRQLLGAFALQAFASAALLGVGGWLVISRQLTLGQLVAAELVVALVVSSVTKFGKHLESFYDMMAAIDKLGYLDDLPLERTSGEGLPHLDAGMRLRLTGVDLGFKNRQLLSDVNWDVPAGARFGVVGATGAGKSTLLDLLYGLRTPDGGVYEVDGRDVRDVRLHDLRSQVALIRHSEVFAGTILENLRLGNPDLDTGMAREALRRVGLLDRVMELPDGLNTQLATGGLPLSPGRSMQLSIARALVGQPRLLILDEALDHLDDLPEWDQLVSTLFDPGATWTLILCSEDPDVLQRCTRVYGIQNQSIQLLPALTPVSPQLKSE